MTERRKRHRSVKGRNDVTGYEGVSVDRVMLKGSLIADQKRRQHSGVAGLCSQLLLSSIHCA